MSDLSDIGFDVETMEDFRELVVETCKRGQKVEADKGFYILFSDKSGAEMWSQITSNGELVGAHPHFKGKSERTVCLTHIVDREESEFDGAYHAWADPTEENNPDSGTYPFVFDVPNFRTNRKIEMPKDIQIQLAAFAQELTCYDNEQQFDESQKKELKFATQSFIPTGLFLPEGEDIKPPQAFGTFTGIIKEWEKKTNEFSGKYFYWMLVDTLGGEVDVVADQKFFLNKEPTIDGIVQGQFWLSGCLINAPAF
jgi:hypothetical protein